MQDQSTTLPAFNSSYGVYMASREWALKKRAVRERSGGICERCKKAPATQVHHLTYERLYRELLSDLLHVCRPCHEYESAVTDYDPAVQPAPPTIAVPPDDIRINGDLHFYETPNTDHDTAVLSALIRWVQDHPGNTSADLTIHGENGEVFAVTLPPIDPVAWNEHRRRWTGPQWRAH